jgi:tetrahydromethanopterin S-methyltransferase subunit B
METIPDKNYKEIEKAIKSDESVVGIDAKKTHIIIIHMLNEITEKLEKLEQRIERLEN